MKISVTFFVPPGLIDTAAEDTTLAQMVLGLAGTLSSKLLGSSETWLTVVFKESPTFRARVVLRMPADLGSVASAGATVNLAGVEVEEFAGVQDTAGASNLERERRKHFH